MRYDASYATEVQRAHPGRIAIVKAVDSQDPKVVEDIDAQYHLSHGLT